MVADFLLVLPFCSRDGDLALKNLRWIQELDGSLPFECLLSWDDATPRAIIDEMNRIAREVFKNVHHNFYPPPDKKHWPAAPNCAFQNTARYVAHFFRGKHWLFLEADATPIRKGWLQDLDEEYRRAGKPFMGHVVGGMGHPNGVMVYPSDVALYSQDVMRVEETAWDVVLGATVDSEFIRNVGGRDSQGGPTVHLIQHCWNMEPDGKCTNGHGEMPTFKSVQDAITKVDLSAAVFHRCKDGSLIHWLREYYKAPHKAMVPDHTSHEVEQKHSNVEDVRRVGAVVPDPVERPADPVQSSEGKPFTGRCEIFIVTYGLPTKRVSGQVVSDFDWLRWCLRGIRRHCTGFAGITLAIPGRDAELLKPIANEHAQSRSGIPLRIKMFNEPTGKGFLMHEAAIGSADEFVPPGTTHVLHLDADCIACGPVTPDEYVNGNKPVYVIRSYESLRDANGVVSDCHQWKSVAETSLGMPIEFYTMLRHPSCFPLDFYKQFRAHIEVVHGKPFLDYVLSCKNSFPQTYAEFPSMGAWAYAKMHDRFNWMDVSGGNHLAPRDKFKVFWSHGGIVPEIQKEIETMIA